MIRVGVHTDQAGPVEAHAAPPAEGRDRWMCFVEVRNKDDAGTLTIWGANPEQLASWLRGAAVEVERAAARAAS